LSITKFVKPFTILKTKILVVGLGKKDSTLIKHDQAVNTALRTVQILSGLTVSPQSTSNGILQTMIEAVNS
jgi:hypothetical protein